MRLSPTRKCLRHSERSRPSSRPSDGQGWPEGQHYRMRIAKLSGQPRSDTVVPAFRSAVRLPYQYSFKPNCICRGELPSEFTRPKLALLKSLFGAPQTTRFSTLNASARTSTRILFDAVIVFAMLMFSWRFQGRRKSPFRRGALPNWPTG